MNLMVHLIVAVVVFVPILTGVLIGVLRQRNAMLNHKSLSTWKVLFLWLVVEVYRDAIFNFFDKVAQFISQLCGSYSVLFGDFIFVRLLLKLMYGLIPTILLGYFLGRMFYYLRNVKID